MQYKKSKLFRVEKKFYREFSIAWGFVLIPVEKIRVPTV